MQGFLSKTINASLQAANKIAIIGLLVVTAILVTLLQDGLHAYFNNYTFYWSESLLYKSFWLVFAPLGLLLISGRRKQRTLGFSVRVPVILASSILHLILFALFVSTISALFYPHHFTFESTFRYAFAEYWYLCMLIYGVLAFMPFAGKEKQTIASKETPSKVPLEVLILKKGNQHFRVATSEICYIQTTSPYVSLHTPKNRYLSNDTLKAMQEKLNPDQFIRIHKSTIINLKKLQSYSAGPNGDYEVQLQNGTQLRMSRHYAKNLKKLLS